MTRRHLLIAVDSSPGPEGPPPKPAYSRAFEQIVKQPDDIVGLLAYALYKKVLHTKMREGQTIPAPAQRVLTDTEIGLYTDQADRYLRLFSAKIIEQETPRILQSALLREVRKATGFWWPGVAIGVVAWLISIVITILVVYSAPSWVQDLVHHITPPPGG